MDLENAIAEPDAFGARLEEALRAPLARIVTQAENIGQQVDGPIRRDYADYANDIASAGRHLLGLIDDLVDLQAVERQDFQPLAETLARLPVEKTRVGAVELSVPKHWRLDEGHARFEDPYLGIEVTVGPRGEISSTGDDEPAFRELLERVRRSARTLP